jgi:hypothetical protein
VRRKSAAGLGANDVAREFVPPSRLVHDADLQPKPHRNRFSTDQTHARTRDIGESAAVFGAVWPSIVH